MKKIKFCVMMALVLTVFSACQKDELRVEEQDVLDSVLEKPDVYYENGFLVFKSYAVADSVRAALINRSFQEQKAWENSLGFNSAKTYRTEVSEKLGEIGDINKAEAYISKLKDEGYFSMQDSSMCYPFYNHSWDCILNKNGIIKIGDVLYCFQKDAQISIIDGKVKTLNQFLNNSKSCDTTLVKVYSSPKLKSTIPTNYGTVASERIYSDGGGVRWTLKFCYDKITMPALAPNGQLITVQTGVKYYLYFHKEKKGTFGWRDSKGIFSHQHLSYNLGGNYDPIQGDYSTNFTNMTPAAYYTQLNTSELSNVYLDVKGWIFNGALSPIPSSYPGPAPIINNFSCNGKLNTISTPINLTIN